MLRAVIGIPSQGGLAGGFDPRRAVAACEPQDAETGAEALLGMWLGFHDRFDEGDRGGPILAASRSIRAGVHSA